MEIRKVSRLGDGKDFGLKSGPLGEERTAGIAMAIGALERKRGGKLEVSRCRRNGKGTQELACCC